MKPRQPAAPPPEIEAQRDQERAIKHLIQAWAGGASTTKEWAKENHNVGQETWTRAKRIALRLHDDNGRALFEEEKGRLRLKHTAAWNEVNNALVEQFSPII